jgi:hypothetical protein
MNYQAAIIYLAILVLTFDSCISSKSVESLSSTMLEAKDRSKYTSLKGPFYTDKFGKLFEEKRYSVGRSDDMVDSQIYFDSVVVVNIGDSTVEKALSDVLDLKTFTEFDQGTMFSKDKNHVYFSYVSSSGAYRVIVNGADPKSFKPLSDYRYGMDNGHLFYKSKMIKGLNFKRHQILYSLAKDDFFVDYVKDDKVVFYDGDTVKGADAKTFRLVSGQKWAAEDKNYKYQCCGQRFE